jgi:hypothetical protein
MLNKCSLVQAKSSLGQIATRPIPIWKAHSSSHGHGTS